MMILINKTGLTKKYLIFNTYDHGIIIRSTFQRHYFSSSSCISQCCLSPTGLPDRRYYCTAYHGLSCIFFNPAGEVLILTACHTVEILKSELQIKKYE